MVSEASDTAQEILEGVDVEQMISQRDLWLPSNRNSQDCGPYDLSTFLHIFFEFYSTVEEVSLMYQTVNDARRGENKTGLQNKGIRLWSSDK